MSTITIPGKELSAAIKDLNSVLEKADRIKIVGNSNANKIKQFSETIFAIIEGGDEENIPEKAAEVYTKYIKDGGQEEDTPEEKAAPAKKGSRKAPAKKGTAAKKSTPAKKGAAKKGGTTKKKAPAKKEVERDDFGFSVNTKKHEFIEMISKEPMKMSELKAETGDTYYNTVSAFPDRILKTSTAHFYVKGSPAEKKAKALEAQAKKDKAAADKAKKAAAAKKTTTKKAPAKKGGTAKKTTGAKKTTTKRTTRKK